MKTKAGAFRLFLISALAASAVSIACIAQERGPGLGPSPDGVVPSVPQPVMPETIPGYTQLDPATGLHVTGTPVLVDLATYRLKVSGDVDRELELTFDDIRRLPRAGSRPLLVCEGFFADSANWAGASLASVLERAGVRPSATRLVLTTADDYTVTVSLRETESVGAYLAYELEGKPIPVIHGFPVRAVFPTLQGYMWAKWLVAMRVE